MDRNNEKKEQTTKDLTEMYNGKTSAIWQHQTEMHLIKAHAERLVHKMMKRKGKEGPFFQQKEEEKAKLQPLKQTAKIIMQPLKLIAIHLLCLISFYFSLHTNFLHFSHTYKQTGKQTYKQTGKQTDRQSNHQ